MMNRILFERNSYLKISELKKLSITAFFAVLGILIPYITGHAFGIKGTIFLPMHLPILLCGVICGYKYGGMCGIIVPVLSSALTEMPVMFPMLPIMIVEVSLYGFVIGLLVEKMKFNVIVSLLIALVCGKLGYALMFAILTYTSGNILALTAVSAFITGIPGICIQLLVVPFVVLTLKKGVLNKYLILDDSIKEAVNLIESNEASIVVIKHKKIVYIDTGKGVAPLIKLYEGNSQLMRNSFVIDKVIGKGAAVILAKGKIKGVHSLLMSKPAMALLESNGIKYSSKEETDYIINQNKTGMCPIESTVLEETDIDLALFKIKNKLSEMMKNRQ